MIFKLNINNAEHEIDVDPAMPLLWALRDHIGLTGTKYGCGAALCGACTVHLDGEPVRSCQVRVDTIGNRPVVTIEGVDGKVARAVQSSWQKLDVVQCGYCQPGQIMTAAALLKAKKKPSDAEIDAALSGNLCRCGTYQRIRAAMRRAAELAGA